MANSDKLPSQQQEVTTADWRKYPKGPNFLGIVIGSSVVLVILLVAAYFFLRSDASKAIPHGPNPTPNSMVVQPLSLDRTA